MLFFSFRKSCIPKTVCDKSDMEFQAQPTMTLDNTQQGFPQVAQSVGQQVVMPGVQGLPIQFIQPGTGQFPMVQGQGVQGQQVCLMFNVM